MGVIQIYWNMSCTHFVLRFKIINSSQNDATVIMSIANFFRLSDQGDEIIFFHVLYGRFQYNVE